MYYGSISKKPRGLSAKCSKLDFLGIVFLKENPWTKSTSPWTAPAWSIMDRTTIAALGSSPELGLRPLRCPRAPSEGQGRGRAGRRAQWRGLPRLGRRWKGVSPVAEASAQKGDGEGAVRAKRGSVGGVGGFTEGGVGFYRAGEGRAPSIAGLKELQWRG
jgi:hypothetical protein